jgi:hypothetical protein
MPMSPLAADLSALSIKEIREATRKFINVPHRVLLRRNDLLDYVGRVGSEDLIQTLVRLSAQKQQSRENQRVKKTNEHKRRHNDNQNQVRRVARKVEEIAEEQPEVGLFMELPTQEEVRQCYRDFFKATGSKALSMAVCGVCGREVDAGRGGVVVQSLGDIPNSNRLIPWRPHPAHDLFDGMLLEPRGVSDTGMGIDVNICRECLKELQDPVNTPPPLSLANNLWVGRIPWELSSLTFSEQLLIAHLYPRVFVFKLYPKTVDRRLDGLTLQKGMRGNVSTFELDSQGIVSMIAGKMMPRPLSVLASVISVTFIGYGKLPVRYLRGLFRVRRRMVLQALQWLKINNPKYYGDIIIDTDQLQNLPEDDVPDEVLGIVRQSDDVGMVEQERAGYIYNEDDESPGE